MRYGFLIVALLVGAAAHGAFAGGPPKKPPTTRPPTTRPPTTRPPTTRPPTTAPPTTPPPAGWCYCLFGISCASSLSNLASGTFSGQYLGPHSNTKCASLPNNSGAWYKCWETPFFFRQSSNCELAPPDCTCKQGGRVQCFDSLSKCRSQHGGTQLSPGSTGGQCSALNKPVWSCTNSDCVCRFTHSCDICTHGGGNQDPHFLGFDGSEYYFDGVAGKEYNIISDVDLQLNAHFIRLNNLKGTYMGRLGFLFGEHSLSFDPHFGVFFNGSLITSGEVELDAGSFLVDDVDGRPRMVFQNDVYHITAVVAVEKGDKEESYINVRTSLYGVPTRPHGILGQTARIAIPGADPLPRPFAVEGGEDDYLVQDGLLGTDFTFNRFVGHVEHIVTASGSRFRRSLGAPIIDQVAGLF